jgi:hypothetical protein
MKRETFSGAIAVALVAGCAQTGTAGDSSHASAEAQCRYFAREEGMEWVQTSRTAASGNGVGVTMQLKDALGRPFNATCVYAGGTKRWAEPLPSNAVARQRS